MNRDTLKEIFDFLEPNDLINCAKVSKSWEQYSSFSRSWKRWYDLATETELCEKKVNWKDQISQLHSQTQQQQFQRIYPFVFCRSLVLYRWHILVLLICIGILWNIFGNGFQALAPLGDYRLSVGIVKESVIHHWTEERENCDGKIEHYNRYQVQVTIESDLNNMTRTSVFTWNRNRRDYATNQMNKFRIGEQQVIYISPTSVSLTRDQQIDWYHILLVTFFLTLPISISPFFQLLFIYVFQQYFPHDRPLFAYPIAGKEKTGYTKYTVMVPMLELPSLKHWEIIYLSYFSVLFLQLFGTIPLASLLFFQNDPNLLAWEDFTKFIFGLEVFISFSALLGCCICFFDSRDRDHVTVWKEGREIIFRKGKLHNLYLQLRRNKYSSTSREINHVLIKICYEEWGCDGWMLRGNWKQEHTRSFTLYPNANYLYDMNSTGVKWINVGHVSMTGDIKPSGEFIRWRFHVRINSCDDFEFEMIVK